MPLTGQKDFLKEGNKTKNTIIQIFSENQSYFQNNYNNKNLYFLKNISQGKTKIHAKDLTTSNRFSV